MLTRDGTTAEPVSQDQILRSSALHTNRLRHQSNIFSKFAMNYADAGYGHSYAPAQQNGRNKKQPRSLYESR